MLKIEKEYNEKYSDIPSEYDERIKFICDKSKLNLSHPKVINTIEYIKNIKWKKLEYTIYLLPKATPRPRSGKNGIFYVKGAKDNKKFFKNFMKTQPDVPLITTPTKFYCDSYFPTPNSMNNIEKLCAELGLIHPVSKPDWDNVAKAYCDMIQGILIYDDSLIIEGALRKFYSIKPRIEIKIEYMENYDCNFNKRKLSNKKVELI